MAPFLAMCITIGRSASLRESRKWSAICFFAVVLKYWRGNPSKKSRICCVGVRQQAQHAKIVRGCHHIGELLDHVHVAEIPAQNNLRHLQVVLDDKNNFLRLLRRELEPIEDDSYTFRTRAYMIALVVTMRFTDVVKQQRQQKQLRIFQFIKNGGKMVRDR